MNHKPCLKVMLTLLGAAVSGAARAVMSWLLREVAEGQE
jgi:hypothetical protein